MKRLIELAAVALLCGCVESATVEAEQRRWRLPNELAEISGLAVDADGRLLAHDDERGVVRTIDALSGDGVIAELPLDDPVPRGDFEGIAVLDEHIYVITSEGELFDWTPDRLERTDLEPGCEVEGLTDFGSRLVAVCKTIPKVDARRIRMFFIDPAGPAITERREIPMNFKIRPSAIEWDPAEERFYVLSARPQPRVVVIEADDAVRVVALDGKQHGQPEGIALVDDGWFVSDEGKPAMLTFWGELP